MTFLAMSVSPAGAEPARGSSPRRATDNLKSRLRTRKPLPVVNSGGRVRRCGRILPDRRMLGEAQSSGQLPSLGSWRRWHVLLKIALAETSSTIVRPPNLLSVAWLGSRGARSLSRSEASPASIVRPSLRSRACASRLRVAPSEEVSADQDGYARPLLSFQMKRR